MSFPILRDLKWNNSDHLRLVNPKIGNVLDTAATGRKLNQTIKDGVISKISKVYKYATPTIWNTSF